MAYPVGDSYSCISFSAKERERLTLSESKDQVYAKGTIGQAPVLSENGLTVGKPATFIVFSIN